MNRNKRTYATVAIGIIVLCLFGTAHTQPTIPPQTPGGFYYPVNDTISDDRNWLACGEDYYSNTRHIGADLIYGIGTPVYAISPGTVVYKSGPEEERGWGIGNYGIVIRHSSAKGDFFAVYGHIETKLNEKDSVSWRQRIGTVGPYRASVPHLHFGIYPDASGFPKSGWGRLKDVGCVNPDSTLGFVAPISFIRENSPSEVEASGTSPDTVKKIDLSGNWNGIGYGSGDSRNEVRIRQVGNRVEAVKVTGSENVPAGQVSWYGTFDSNPFNGKMKIARPGFKDVRWHDISVRIIDGNNFVVTMVRNSSTNEQLVYGSIRFERIVETSF